MPDFTEFKQRAAVVWSAGAFEDVAESIHDVHIALAEALEPHAGEQFLDVGCGAGHLAELAAGAGAEVTGVDLSPRLIDVARARAEAAGLDIDYSVGDAENLDVADASFDVVGSSFGMIFAPDHGAAARELARATRPGGRLGFSAWTPDGSIGEMFKVFAQFQPPPPEGAGTPLQWGTDAHVHEQLGDAFELTIERRFSVHEDESAEQAWEYFAPRFGPVRLLLDNLPPERREEFQETALAHYKERVGTDGHFRDEREYLLVTGIRR
ncbi:MAG TPA: class I SAM-dependent methyltransferase [Gaiellaceae bacterium]|nr:class I SAM-dependent methyltransferase [Gaiellaceae bacterium]